MIRTYPVLRGLIVFSLFVTYWVTIHPRLTGVPSALMEGAVIGMFLGVLATTMAHRVEYGRSAIAPGTAKTVGLAGFSFMAGWLSNFNGDLSGLDYAFVAILLVFPIALYFFGLRADVQRPRIADSGVVRRP